MNAVRRAPCCDFFVCTEAMICSLVVYVFLVLSSFVTQFALVVLPPRTRCARSGSLRSYEDSCFQESLEYRVDELFPNDSHLTVSMD